MGESGRADERKGKWGWVEIKLFGVRVGTCICLGSFSGGLG